MPSLDESNSVQIVRKTECRLCFQEIDERAELCPFCNAPQRRKRFRVVPGIALASSILAMSASTIAVLLYLALEEANKELEDAQLSLTSLATELNERTARAPPPSPPAQAPTPVSPTPDRREPGSDFAFDSAKLQAAWELLRNCDEIPTLTCKRALTEFRQHLPESRYLHCETNQLDSSRLCWLALE